MKYIDAEKLKYEIERRLQENADKALVFGAAFAGRTAEDNDLKNLIISLQQEQPEMDLENAIQNYTETLYHQTFGNGQNTFDEFDWEDIAQVIEDSARHFYELGNAKKNESELFECPETPIAEAVEVTSRMQYIDEDFKLIAHFIMNYAHWNLHKTEWNQPTIEVPLFRVLDAFIQKGKPYCEG